MGLSLSPAFSSVRAIPAPGVATPSGSENRQNKEVSGSFVFLTCFLAILPLTPLWVHLPSHHELSCQISSTDSLTFSDYPCWNCENFCFLLTNLQEFTYFPVWTLTLLQSHFHWRDCYWEFPTLASQSTIHLVPNTIRLFLKRTNSQYRCLLRLSLAMIVLQLLSCTLSRLPPFLVLENVLIARTLPILPYI